MSTVDTQLESARADHGVCTDEMSEIQGRFYQLGADIGRAEESIENSQDRVRELEADLESIDRRHDETTRQLTMDDAHIQALETEIASKKPELERSEERHRESSEELHAAEHAMQSWQQRWDEFSGRSNLNDSEMQVQESRIEHLDQVLQRLRARRDQLDAETQEPADGDADVRDLAAEVDRVEANFQAVEADLDTAIAALAAAREDVLMRERVLEEARTQVHTVRHEFAALSAVQEAALGRSVSEVDGWVESQGLHNAARLGEGLTVVPGWEHAVETVLGDNIQAIRVRDVSSFAEALTRLEDGAVTLYEGADARETTGNLPALETFVRCDSGTVGTLLGDVLAADSVQVALNERKSLTQSQSIITREGVWIGPDWIRLDRGSEAAHGIIQRGLELESLRTRVEDAEARLSELQGRVVEGKQRVETLESDRDGLQTRQSSVGKVLAQLRTDHGVHRVREEEAEARRARVERDREEIDHQVSQESDRLTHARARLTGLVRDAEELARERDELIVVRDRETVRLEHSRVDANEARDRYHGLRVECQALDSSLAASQTARDRLVKQGVEMAERRGDVVRNIADAKRPLPELREQLEEKLAERVAVESQLAEVRQRLEDLETMIRQHTEQRREAEVAIEQVRGRAESERIEREGLVVNIGNLDKLLADSGLSMQEALERLDDETEETLGEILERLERRITRLGPINLAAIEEFESESERKIYLDRQNDDLVEALDTLQKAIKRIDRETRTRFKETFDQVNEHLKTLFPKVFGGGHAQLELTGEDLLDTGITLMAQPPGKRNASVHLLSGGEKAMTAVALVFAIFQLNPSPVCLLDEVDAPLDDTNVARFADLIKEMSSEVQFVVITHNKLTMEMADHLLGVTMHEAGVSRLVSVDVEQAAEMAAV